MSEIVTSTGVVGLDPFRSEGRVYETLGEVCTAPDQLMEEFGVVRGLALDRGKRRWVLRAVVEEDVRSDIGDSNNIEVDIPVGLTDNRSSRRLIVLAENIHRSEVPEWEDVYRFWQEPYPKEIDPFGNLDSISEQFQLTRIANISNPWQHEEFLEDLFEIWRPFGWTRKGIQEFTHKYSNLYFVGGTKDDHGVWFSGVRDRSSRRLVSACQAESLYFGGVLTVELTEFGTKPDFQGKGLCSAAVTGLIAQVLRDTLYAGGGYLSSRPLIFAELNMTTRSDVIARKVGMTIPSVEGQTGLQSPTQVLRRNVSILDGYEPNDLRLVELVPQFGGPLADHFRDAYGENYPYWRNFIVGILPREAINRYYPFEQTERILAHYEPVR